MLAVISPAFYLSVGVEITTPEALPCNVLSWFITRSEIHTTCLATRSVTCRVKLMRLM